MYIYTYIWRSMFMYTYIHTYIHVYTYIYKYIYIYIFILSVMLTPYTIYACLEPHVLQCGHVEDAALHHSAIPTACANSCAQDRQEY